MSVHHGKIGERISRQPKDTDDAGNRTDYIVSADVTKLGQIATLLFRLQLLRLGFGASLAGLQIAIDDGIILTPNPCRVPGPRSVTTPIPCGVNTDDMLAALEGRSLSHAGLIEAFTLVTQAEIQLEAAHQKARSRLDAFVAALCSPG
ncbi:hypothetical protein [Sinorhizobium fredii]|uniref:hypothetical protein n=1 Tax=Rhizobium fredii TaxID=380 RepID=UPI000560EAE5|nr:hypothetical protein [Sinorhizobium fredii]UTY48554.1 hypothetical protein EPK84_18130 [Sinorhizobium fredii]